MAQRERPLAHQDKAPSDPLQFPRRRDAHGAWLPLGPGDLFDAVEPGAVARLRGLAQGLGA